MPDRTESGGGGADRPNIVWFVSEDCSPHGGALGDGVARTPTIDRLAAEGVVWDNAFCTYPVCAPSRFAIISGVHPQTVGAQQMRSTPPFPADLTTYPQVVRDAGYYCTNNPKTDYNCDLDPQAIWDESGPQAHWSHAPAGQPFLAVFNSNGTHESSIFDGRVGPVAPEQVRVPGYLPDTPQIRTDLACYYTAVEAMDADFASRIDELEQAGVLQDTVLLYSSDHGGVGPWSKRYCHDAGLRVPLLVWAPPRWRHLLPGEPGTRISEPVTTIAVPPTLADLAGAPVPDSMVERSLLDTSRPPRRFAFGARDRMDERYDLVRTARDERYRYLRTYLPHRPEGQHVAFAWQAQGYQSLEQAWLDGTLDPDQARFFEPRPAEQLYDTWADPDHRHNLAADPDHADRLNEMSCALDDFMLAIGDTGFAPEGSSALRYPIDPATYPLPELLDLAALAISRDPAHAARLCEALSDAREVVRFWAAQGLLMLSEGAAPAAGALVTAAESDPSPHVRVVAAEALTHLGTSEPSIDLLVALLDEQYTVPVRLQALNALTYAHGDRTTALPVLERMAEQEQDQYLRNASRYLAGVLAGTYRPTTTTFVRPTT